MQHVLAILAGLAMAACTQPEEDWTAGLIVDECAHTEFRNECDLTVGHEDNASPTTPQELAACYQGARASALRFPSAVTPDCLVPGAPARPW